MNTVRKEIRDLITINEKIQSALLHGDRITDDEAPLIRQCASELLEKLHAPRHGDARHRALRRPKHTLRTPEVPRA